MNMKPHFTKRPPLRARRGFTLIELLLVVMIAALSVVLVIPGYVNSMRGAKLKSSVESIRSVNRHAKAMAVLQQKNMGIRYNEETGVIDVITMKRSSNTASMDGYTMEMAGYRAMGLGDSNESIQDEYEAEQRELFGVEAVMTRKLAKGVMLTEFESNTGEAFDRTVHAVRYPPTGVVEGHMLRIEDDKGIAAILTVEHITGSISVEYENY